ncbi:hypothetical protein CONPUDRAFT_88295 [Coniophora puteana RWD-64-598 SS2]|uniref:Uncharacterized protein n=1 Tax=Coniophora puteana (strain RWD-64-598) TaxID=741705 RepID=A0A5M3MY06_CONPW|nr:uncharacterized protein CONPUDRAFT_88295 [Coniophora puteana RWD-64-598 SS2]EIW83916.1 hypothetical protein CONPUDRAFT_88295 [Coniophora puteana RWD-64-598 SS2]
MIMLSHPNSPPMPGSIDDRENRELINIHLSLSPKRSYDNDGLALLDAKRRHLQAQGDSYRRRPFDRLPAALFNVRDRDSLPSQPTGPRSASVDSSRVIDKQHESPAAHETKRWDGHASTTWLVSSNRDVRPPVMRPRRHSSAGSDAWTPWLPADRYRVAAASQKPSPPKAAERLVLKTRSNSPPKVNLPPSDLWRANDARAPSGASYLVRSQTAPVVRNVDHLHHGTASPPGLQPRRSPPARRSSWHGQSNEGSLSLFLTSDSSPVENPSAPKALAPIGSERKRAASIKAALPSRSPSPPVPTLNASSHSSWPPLTSNLNQLVSDNTSSDNLLGGLSHNAPFHFTPSIDEDNNNLSQADFNRLLRNAQHNKYAPKILSPLNPLINPIPPFYLTIHNSVYNSRVSGACRPSRRYQDLGKPRSRSTCDSYFPDELESWSTHCSSCKRDSLAKKLLISRHYHAVRTDAYRKPPTVLAPSVIYSEPESMLVGEQTVPFFPSSNVDLKTPPGGPLLRDLDDFDVHVPEIPDEDLFGSIPHTVHGRLF